jgi:type VI secretion system protein ImpA
MPAETVLTPDVKIVVPDERCNLDFLLRPIPGESAAGENTGREVRTQIEMLRANDDQQGSLRDGGLKQGEVRVADPKAILTLASQTLSVRSKDLPIAIYCAEAMANLYGMPGAYAGLCLIKGLVDNFWSGLYPHIEDDDPGDRAVWFERLDTYLAQRLVDVPIAKEFEGKRYTIVEWDHCQIQMSEANRMPQETPRQDKEKKAAITTVRARQEHLEKAVAKTPVEFYHELSHVVTQCAAVCEQLRDAVDRRFRDEPGVGNLENPIPNFDRIRTTLRKFAGRIANILQTRPAPPSDGNVPNPQQPSDVNSPNVNSPNVPDGPPGQLRNRADAIRMLQTVRDYFKSTEPSSPVSYGIDRALAWSGMSLEEWLDAMVHDATVLAKLRDNLGLPAKEKAK